MKIKKSKILKLDFLKHSKTIEIMKKLKSLTPNGCPKIKFPKRKHSWVFYEIGIENFFLVALKKFHFLANTRKLKNQKI